MVDGRELVIWRGADHEAHVWEDRCPHRGMRLSFGFVRGNSLNCLYHGWQYGGRAQCQHIPAHPDLTVPPSIRADAYPSLEAGGMVWTQLDGSTDDQPPALPAETKPLASLAVAADAETIRTVVGGAPTILDAQLFSLSQADTLLHFGWHLVHSGKTMLHAVIEGGSHEAAMRLLRKIRALAERSAVA